MRRDDPGTPAPAVRRCPARPPSVIEIVRNSPARMDVAAIVDRVRRISSVRFCIVRSRAIVAAPAIRFSPSRIGEMVSETSMR